MAHTDHDEMNQATTCAVTVMAASLTWAFSSGDNPRYILLVVIEVVTTFFVAVLGLELWPLKRHTKEAFRESDPATWNEDTNDDG